MNITVEKLPKCTAVIRAEIPADQVASTRDSITQSFSSQARIPGFRPGKTPKAVILKRYDAEISEELQSRLVQAAFQQAVTEDKDLQVLHFKDPDEFSINPDDTVSISAPVVLAPEFELKEYKGVAVEVPSEEVDQAEKDNALADLRQRFANYSDVEEKRGLVKGDLTVINFEGKIDGAPVAEVLGESAAFLGGREEYWLKIEDSAFLDGFTDQLLDAKVGEKRSFSIEVKEDFAIEAARKQTIDYSVEVTSIKQEELPELNDEFAAKLLPDGTLDKLKELIESQLSSEKQQRIERIKEDSVLEKIAEQYDFEMPDDFLTSETQRQVDLIAQQGMQEGWNDSAMEKQEDMIIQEAERRATNSLKVNFLLNKIAEKESISVEQKELLAAVESYAKQAKKSVKQYIKQLGKESLSNIRHNLMLSKTVKFLVESAEVSTSAESNNEPA